MRVRAGYSSALLAYTGYYLGCSFFGAGGSCSVQKYVHLLRGSGVVMPSPGNLDFRSSEVLMQSER